MIYFVIYKLKYEFIQEFCFGVLIVKLCKNSLLNSFESSCAKLFDIYT